tara:strand:- start:692 stop:1684 length:993 start_codon:yes stop_codon:yes gene_type:complete
MIIAEIGLSHDGNIDIAHTYIDSLVDKGVDIIKFQTHVAEAESSRHEKFRVVFNNHDKSRFDYWKRTEFSFEKWLEIKNHCDKKGFEFMSTPSCLEAVDLLEKLNVNRYKVGSGDVDNLLLLKKLGITQKPILLSSGMSPFFELEEAIQFLDYYKNPISILQCTSKYPTTPKEWGLNVIPELQSRFKLPIGFSDHSGTIYASLGAAMMGAEIIEFHVILDGMEIGPDVSSSIPISKVQILTEGVKAIKCAMENPVNKNNIEDYEEIKKLFGKSLSLNKDKNIGERIFIDDLESKKPYGHGIATKNFEMVIGKKINKNLKKWSFLNWDDFE